MDGMVMAGCGQGGMARAGRRLRAAACAGMVVACAAACGSAAGPHARYSPARGASAARATHAVPASAPASAYVKRADFLNSVSCTAVSACTAVGSHYYGATRPRRTLIERWNGTAWQLQRSPGQGRGSQLTGVSCAAANACTAVGSPAQAWNGTRWRVSPAAPVTSVSCLSPASCQAVGVSPQGRPLAARWDGRTWQAESVPMPPGQPQTITLAGVSCATAMFCMAVGDYSSGAGARPSPAFRDRTLAEAWDGSRWRIVHTASPANRSALSGVSCTSPRACMAVGTSTAQRTLAERWNGTSWRAERTPNVNNIGYSSLYGVSCASPGACIAVGTYNGGIFGIAERWNGTAWTIERLPSPPGQAVIEQPSVSCTSPTACTAVATDLGRTLAEAWNGKSWDIQPTPDPP